MRKFIVTSVAFNAQQNGGRKVFGPPDLCRSGSRDLAEGRDVFAFNHTEGGHAYGASECPLSGEQRVLILRLAPFFGRGQDVGFQKAIDNSPRKRHHIRFWALSLAYVEANFGKASFWLNKDRPPDAECVHWIGAGTKDTGISLTRLTFQITHATDSDTNVERDYIIDELRKSGVIGEINSYKAGQHLGTKHVNHYVTDGEVTAASLMVKT